MTRHNRLIRAVHAGLVCWVAGALFGMTLVLAIPEKWMLRTPTKLGLVVHHIIPIVGGHLLQAIAFAVVFKILIDIQHERDLQEKSRK